MDELTTIDPQTGRQVLNGDVLTKLIAKHQAEQRAAAAQDVPVAEMAQARGGLLGGLGDIQIFGVEVGRALGGGSIALLASEVIDGFLNVAKDADGRIIDQQQAIMSGLVKLTAGGFLTQFVSGFVGRDLSNTAALFLAFDAVRDILPLDDLVRNLLGFLPGRNGGGSGSAGQVLEPSAHNGSTSEESALDHALLAIR
ncbi:MAG: hypothetical protein WD533_06445 [Dehalococcoidia bacterium]